mmetsp:Transcript_16542/g.27437  ORF Transcript_16542/g.27437 Transcript_16542/m.27437 type:complete len:172 (+) Transcript_16542:27-542(+)
MTSAAPSNYGAVEDSGELDRSFDVTETYYLKEGNTSPEERRRKCFSIMVPILAAVLMVSGAAFFLLKDFSHLYPGSGGDPRDYNAHNDFDEPVAPAAPTPTAVLEPRGPKLRPTALAPVPTSSSRSSSTASSSIATSDSPMCEENDKCYDLGLTGRCCPTFTGDYLGCCHH